MGLEDPHRQDEAVDDVMAAIYQELDDHVSDSDAPYDVEAGLGQLMERRRAEREPAHLPAVPVRTGELERGAADPIPHHPEEHAASRLYEIAAEAEMQAAWKSDRRGYFFFSGIIVMAMTTLGLLAFGHLSSAVAAAMAAVSGVTAVAGVLIHRSAGVVRRYAEAREEPFAGTEGSRGEQSRSKQRKRDVTNFAFKTPLFSVEFQRSQRSSPRSDGPPRRMVAGLLGLLMAVCATVFVASAIEIVISRPASANEIGLIAAGAASLLLAIIRWWWRIADLRKVKKVKG
jgi:uncharacterized DUF497 family protein